MVTSERKLEQLKESDKMKRTAARMNAENGRHRKRTESETCFCLLLCLFFLRLRRTTIELNLFFFTEDSLDYISFCCVFSKHLFRFKLEKPVREQIEQTKMVTNLVSLSHKDCNHLENTNSEAQPVVQDQKKYRSDKIEIK